MHNLRNISFYQNYCMIFSYRIMIIAHNLKSNYYKRASVFWARYAMWWILASFGAVVSIHWYHCREKSPKFGAKETSHGITVGCSIFLADGEGFEPPVDLRPHNLSKVAPSTTRTPLQSLPFALKPTRPPRSAKDGARSGTRTRTYSRIADFESAAAAITPPWLCSVLERAKGIEPS